MNAVFGNSRRLLPETKPNGLCADVERVKGIEPSCSAGEADVLPLNYTRVPEYYSTSCPGLQGIFTRTFWR